jgi:hypothetical protein
VGGISEEIHADRILKSIIIKAGTWHSSCVRCDRMSRGCDQLLCVFGNLVTEVAEIFANCICLVFPFLFCLGVTVGELLKSDGGLECVAKSLGAGRSEV